MPDTTAPSAAPTAVAGTAVPVAQDAARDAAFDGVRGRWRPLLWPVLALVAALCWWALIVANNRGDRAQAEHAALKEVGAYSEAYEQYITRSIGQMDQVTMQLKQSWEQSGNALRLEDMKRDGMFTDSAFAGAAIVDAHGKIRTSTRKFDGQQSVAASDYFRFHQNNNSTALRIGVPPREHGARQGVVQFTRRLDTPDDSFDGVIVLSVHADYFTSFYTLRTLGRQGLVAMLGEDSALRLERHGDGVVLPASASILTALPEFGPGEEAGRVAGSGFSDDKERVLAWRRSSAYPVVALAGVAHSEAMAEADAYWSDSRNRAIALTLLLLLLGACGALASHRAQLRRHEQREVQRAYRMATESAKDGFYMASALRGAGGVIVDFEIVDCNERGASFYGLVRDELLGARLSTLDAGVFGHALLDTYLSAMQTGFYEDERQMPGDSRVTIRWGQRRLVRVGNGLAITLQDISERKEHENDLLRLANQDALTGMPNRYWLNQHLPGALAAAEHGKRGLALLFIDLDEFKFVNDAYGHDSGDAVLVEISRRLEDETRTGDLIARLGGDEFVIMCAGMNHHDADAMAHRVVAAIDRPIAIKGGTITVTGSCGVITAPPGSLAADLLDQADAAMYRAKAGGRNRSSR